jgi:hypothetical protein
MAGFGADIPPKDKAYTQMDEAAQPLLPPGETDDSSIDQLPEPPLRVCTWPLVALLS